MFYQTGISGPHYHAGELGQMREEKRAPLTPMNDTLARATGDRTPWIGIERVYHRFREEQEGERRGRVTWSVILRVFSVTCDCRSRLTSMIA
jgi:hypothetical protein